MLPFALVSAFLALHGALAESCCSRLAEIGVPVSNDKLSYFSLHQADMQPACIAHPATSHQVSSIMKLSNAPCEFRFAVRGAGHMCWRGASNIDAPGFAIDMSAFNDLAYDEELQRVTFGAGLCWGEVYDYLGPYNRTVRGGRMLDVGVAGFLLGGGISFPADTFSSSTVAEYQVVLASGDIVRASRVENSDLFWAMKYGSTNFGIVTRITMETMPDGDVWGGVQVFPMDPAADNLLDELVRLTRNLEGTMQEYMGVLLSSEGPAVVVLRVALAHVPLPIRDGPAILDTLSFGKRPDVWKAWAGQESVMKAEYHQWMTLTLKPNAHFVRSIFEKGVEMYLGRPNAWSIGLQPLPGSLFDDGQPVLLALFISSSPDVNIKSLVDWTRSHTEMVKPFIYMNYASGDQNVYAGAEKERYWDVKNKYDPADILREHWIGGFKLPRTTQHDEL